MGKYTKEDFITKVKELQEKEESLGYPIIDYDYSQVKYVNMRTKISIICPEHGEFKQTPANHLKGQKCPYCAGRRGTTAGFVAKAKKVHGNKYDYSKSDYIGATNKVIIKCNICGNEFKQTPANHLNGQNCPFCSRNEKRQKMLLKGSKKKN